MSSCTAVQPAADHDSLMEPESGTPQGTASGDGAASNLTTADTTGNASVGDTGCNFFQDRVDSGVYDRLSDNIIQVENGLCQATYQLDFDREISRINGSYGYVDLANYAEARFLLFGEVLHKIHGTQIGAQGNYNPTTGVRSTCSSTILLTDRSLRKDPSQMRRPLNVSWRLVSRPMRLLIWPTPSTTRSSP
jgi:hypothetical protein